MLNEILSITDNARPSGPNNANAIGNPMKPELLKADANAHTPRQSLGTPKIAET